MVRVQYRCPPHYNAIKPKRFKTETEAIAFARSRYSEKRDCIVTWLDKETGEIYVVGGWKENRELVGNVA